MWQWLVALVARPVLRPILAVLVAFGFSAPLTKGLFWLYDQAWPTIWDWIQRAVRYAAMMGVALILTALLFDFVLHQEQLLDEGIEAILSIALNAGQGMHGAVCSWARVPRLFCPADSTAPAGGPVVIIVQAPEPNHPNKIFV